MSTFRKIEYTCSVCGEKTGFNVLMSTNSFGSPDLDLRPPEMQRSTMWLWVQKCPHCNYVNTNISEETYLDKEYFSSFEYLSCESLNMPNELADKFYKLYMIKRESGNYDAAYSALLRCAWVCDDCGKKELSCLMRKKMVEIYDKLSRRVTRNESSVAQFADVLRRCGMFDAVIEKFANYEGKDEVVGKVIKFQVELAKNKDDKVYTVRDALKD